MLTVSVNVNIFLLSFYMPTKYFPMRHFLCIPLMNLHASLALSPSSMSTTPASTAVLYSFLMHHLRRSSDIAQSSVGKVCWLYSLSAVVGNVDVVKKIYLKLASGEILSFAAGNNRGQHSEVFLQLNVGVRLTFIELEERIGLTECSLCD